MKKHKRSKLLKRERNKDRVILSAADPLNLTGVILPGARVAALAGHRLMFEDGAVVAVFDHNGTRVLDDALQGEVSAVSLALRRAPGRRTRSPSPAAASHVADSA